MKVRIVALVFPLLGLLVLSAAGRDSEAKGKVYKSPEEVFDAYIAGLNKREPKTYYGCLTPEAVKKIAGEQARRGVQQRRFAEPTKDKKDDKLLRIWKSVFDVMDKHGLTEKATMRPTARIRGPDAASFRDRRAGEPCRPLAARRKCPQIPCSSGAKGRLGGACLTPRGRAGAFRRRRPPNCPRRGSPWRRASRPWRCRGGVAGRHWAAAHNPGGSSARR